MSGQWWLSIHTSQYNCLTTSSFTFSWQYVGLSWTKFSSELGMWHDKACLLTGITVANMHKKQTGRSSTSTPGIFSKPKEGRLSCRVAWSASHLFIWLFSFSISLFPFLVFLLSYAPHLYFYLSCHLYESLERKRHEKSVNIFKPLFFVNWKLMCITNWVPKVVGL